jgi:hypothetical protein
VFISLIAKRKKRYYTDDTESEDAIRVFGVIRWIGGIVMLWLFKFLHWSFSVKLISSGVQSFVGASGFRFAKTIRWSVPCWVGG